MPPPRPKNNRDLDVESSEKVLPMTVGSESVNYDYMIGEPEEGYVGLYSFSTNHTDIFQVIIDQLGGAKLNYLTSIPKQLKVLILHGDRLICDEEVIIGGEVVQTLKMEDMASATAVSLDTLIYG